MYVQNSVVLSFAPHDQSFGNFFCYLVVLGVQRHLQKTVCPFYRFALDPYFVNCCCRCLGFRVRVTPLLCLAMQVAKVPEVSVAFEKFCRRALCQESVLFLKAVAS